MPLQNSSDIRGLIGELLVLSDTRKLVICVTDLQKVDLGIGRGDVWDWHHSDIVGLFSTIEIIEPQ